MKKIFAVLAASAAILSCTGHREFRMIHNNDGSDILSNVWFGRRPLHVEDINKAVDLVAETGATTYMMCSGSDYAYYPSKYARPFGSDRGGELDSSKDTLFLSYFRNFKNLEEEGTDLLRASLTRAKQDGMEAFITYRMNDLHFNDTKISVPVYATDFWMAHPEYWMGPDSRGWHADGALDFSYDEVREHKYDMIAEQLENYSFIDGFEMDFMRFIVYFPEGKGPQNAAKMTDLVRRVRAKADSVGRDAGHRILLAARVPISWESCVDNGLEVDRWVHEGLVDFLTLAPHWKADPAIDVDRFRRESGIGRRIPVYATIDEGTFQPRENLSHGMYRGAASFALSHGADGIYLFNYYFREYLSSGEVPEALGVVCRTRTPELAKELGSLKKLEGRNKSLSYYCCTSEYGLKYNTPMPLVARPDSSASISFYIADKMRPARPAQAVLIFRSTLANFDIKFNGEKITVDDEKYALLYDRMRNLKFDQVHCFVVPSRLLRHGENKVTLTPTDFPAGVFRIELILDYGSVVQHGFF